MADFPILKSGAVAQDGIRAGVRFATQVVHFAGGGEQRFRQRKAGLRQWVIRLEMLTDEESAALLAFLESRQGRHGVFSFFDPVDEVEYLNCSLETDNHVLELRDLAQTAGTIRIRQNWS